MATYNLDQVTEYEFDCQDTPGQSVSGRYLTLQKINNNDEADWDWDVSEVEVYEQATFKGKWLKAAE